MARTARASKRANRHLARGALLALMLALTLATTGCATWAQSRDDATRTGFQGLEFWVGTSNVSGLTERWEADLGSLTEDGTDRTSPTIVNGVAYAGRYGVLLAFDASGTTGCGGSPRVCAPMWSYPTAENLITSTPAIANGVLYLGSAGKLYAFDAKGQDGCFGVPKTCVPLWTATDAFGDSSPAVANGVVYLGTTDGHVDAFDAAGTIGCFSVPRTCTPLWRGAAGTRIDAAPAVARGTVYVASGDGTLYAFDAAGRDGCAGVDLPRTCSPRWTAATGGPIIATPAVADNVVYVGSRDHRLSAFDAAGTAGCAGSPAVCTPLWTADTGAEVRASPAVADGTVFVNGPERMSAYDATGTKECAGVPKSCDPLWRTSAATPGYPAGQPPSVANGVVYVDSVKNDLVAFDAAGTKSCAGTPIKTCTPLWVSANDGAADAGISSGASIVNAVVYVTYFAHNRSRLRAYTLPPA